MITNNLFLNNTSLVKLILVKLKYFILISKIHIFILIFPLFYYSLHLFITQYENNIFYSLIDYLMR